MSIAGQFRPDQTSQVDNPDNGTQPLLEIRNFLSRQWRLIAAVTGCVTILGVIYIVLTPVKYTAKADMIIDTKRVTWTQSEMSTDNRAVEDAAVESEIETTKSDRVALSVIRRLHLEEDPEFVDTGPGLIERLFSLLGFATDPKQESEHEVIRQVLSQVKANLRVTRLGRSYLEQIAYTSLDPDKAAKIANAFADAYIEDQTQARIDATRRASDWLQEGIGGLRQQASDGYQAVQDFKSKNSIIIGVDGKLASELELDQLGIALAKARADTSQARAKLEGIQGVLQQRRDTTSIDITNPAVTDALNSQVVTKLRQKFLEDQSRESEVARRFGADHQTARNLRAEMAALQRAIWDEIARIAESYKSEMQITTTQEESIEKRMAEVFQQSTATRQAQVRLRELETAANTYRNIYETFLSRFTQTVKQQSFPATEARVVTPALPPPLPSWPKVKLTLALAGLCGLGLGTMLAFVREQMNRQIHTRAQIGELLGTNCLAVLPTFPKRIPLGTSRAKQEVTPFRQISEVAPFSATAEALRYIKVAIDLHPGSGKIVGIVSALPGEGKTTVAAGFAAFVAKAGGRVLLIDADLRNPTMSRSLGYADRPNLLNLVADRRALDDLVITDSRYRFDFLPCSKEFEPLNSSDLLNSYSIKEMLKSAKNTYDYVIVDLPPILPVVDVQAVAHLFDAFVMVVEWGSTSTDEIREASSVVSERLVGAVLNKADEAKMRRFENYSDRRYHYYGKDKTSAETA
jgi:polysaccharide biosynthesis transport protein